MKTTNYPATVRELGAMADKLRVKPSELLPPEGFTPNYEFFNVAAPELIDYAGPNIERPGYKILSSWTADGGLRLYIDHDDNEAFTVPELRDLIATVTGILQQTAGWPTSEATED